MRKIKRFGYRPDLGDPRDHLFETVGADLPKSVDLRPNMKFPCWNQGELGACTGFGITALIAYIHGYEGSQLWLYYQERLLENTVEQDSGAQIRDGIKVVVTEGLPPEELWPYNISNFEQAPPQQVNEAAKADLITKYQRLDGPNAYRECLAKGYPFVIGITVFESFETEEVAKTGIVPMPTVTEAVLGGHCISVFGYTEDGDWICRNSWGTEWGDNGYFYLPKAYLESADLACDAWMIIA